MGHCVGACSGIPECTVMRKNKEMIYFDHNATTPILPEVLDVMRDAMEEFWGNPSSTHSVGRKAFARLENARERLAGLIGASAREIYFTSGGTESDNLAILGMMDRHKNGSVVISAIEHPAVHEAALTLSAKGFEATQAPVDDNGQVAIDKLEACVTDNTRLVSIMFANNEIGTVQPVQSIGEMLKKRNIPFHSDAVQALGRYRSMLKRGQFRSCRFLRTRSTVPKDAVRFTLGREHGSIPAASEAARNVMCEPAPKTCQPFSGLFGLRKLPI